MKMLDHPHIIKLFQVNSTQPALACPLKEDFYSNARGLSFFDRVNCAVNFGCTRPRISGLCSRVGDEIQVKKKCVCAD